MILAHLISDSEDLLICDLAETYHILNYRELPPTLVATLVLGLPDHSRLKMKVSGQKITTEQAMLAVIIDDLNLLLWQRSKRRKKPESLYKKRTEEKQKDELLSFSSPEEYEEWMRKKREKWNG